MHKLVELTLAMIIGLGTGAMLANRDSSNTTIPTSGGIGNETGAAFRDGLYLGQRDAEQGRVRHVSVGRWSRSTDRSQYEAGYDAGFGQGTRSN